MTGLPTTFRSRYLENGLLPKSRCVPTAATGEPSGQVLRGVDELFFA